MSPTTLTPGRGESGVGNWTVIVKDTEVNEEEGRFIDWRLNLWGECIDESKQTLHPYPDEHDDDHETTTGSVATTSVSVGNPQTDQPTNPTDHIHRPINAKPSATPGNPSPDISKTPTSAAASSPAPTYTPSDSFLPSFFPTFGVSKRTQIWIYGALVLIILFCMGLGAYFLIQRRKRIRNNPRDDYEFEVLDTAEENGRMNGHTGGKKAKRRAGELYDAFAGGSDEEFFSSEEEGEPYQDAPDENRGRDERRRGSLDSAEDSSS
jgi:kexin